MARKHERSLARRMAVQALYQSEITGTDLCEMAGDPTIIPDGGMLPDYALRLLAEIKGHAEEIDARISSASDNWSLSRMPIVDRAILRASVCEIFFIDDVPVSVSINEAVELAKEFGGEDESSRFVNGILGKIARSMDEPFVMPGEEDSSSDSAESEEGEDSEAQEEASAEAGERIPAEEEEPAEDLASEADDLSESGEAEADNGQ